jgi:hypothetical protein
LYPIHFQQPRRKLLSTTKSLKSAALIAITAAATSILIQACGGGAIAQTTSDVDVIEGVWDSTITIKDCTTNAVMKTFKGAGMFHRGGTLSADNSMPPPSRGAAMGIWKRGTGSNYTANMWFMRFNADGTLAGTQKVQRALVLGADSNSLTGTLTLQIIDASGAVVQQGCGSETAVRVY